MDPLLLKPGEAADLLGVSRSTIYQLLGSGQVPSMRVGKLLRVPAAALQRWVNERAAEAVETVEPDNLFREEPQ
jgi:excisionase family DNA binding protein